MKAQAQTSFSVDCEANTWDPCATLGIINPDRGSFTCVGYAPSKRRRCQNPIARENRDFVFALLESLALLSPNSSEFANLLRQVAYRSLCRRYHQNQADSVVRQWEARISALMPSLPQERNVTVKGEQFERPMKRPQKTDSYYRRYKQEETRLESDGLEQSEQEHGPRRSEQRKKKQEEQEQKEKEQEQREEQARERMRRRAQQQREERERQAREQEREKAVRERRNWQQAWQSYMTKWATFKEANHEPSDPRQAQQLIPWPVKSGLFGDLQASNVKTFYRKACPNAETPAMYQTMQAESLKWHPDKMCKLYRTCTPGDADKLVIEMICRVVLELREEAKALRAG